MSHNEHNASISYYRTPEHDRRLDRGDYFAGDAWTSLETGVVKYTAVGKRPAALNRHIGLRCAPCKGTGIQHAWHDGEQTPVEPLQTCNVCHGTTFLPR